MRPKSDTLTGQELEIMKVIWPRGQATVREVYDELRERRPRLHHRADDDEYPRDQGASET
jgi:Fe2+ or Zn2+ uptake regulation protein